MMVSPSPTVYSGPYESLGLLYGYITEKFSFGWLEGPGKAMGLVPYGKKSKYYEKLNGIMKIDSDGKAIKDF